MGYIAFARYLRFHIKILLPAHAAIISNAESTISAGPEAKQSLKFKGRLSLVNMAGEKRKQ